MAKAAKKADARPAQTIVVQTGNEVAATAAKHVDYHIMGYYPITPSTEIAETLDAMKAEGEHDIRMIPGDGEHGAAGICFGATSAGGRVFNATSANGLLFAFEQLPVQSGTRFPMVFNIVTRSVSGPLDIRGDHSDIMLVMNTGWIILMASDAQAVYDMNDPDLINNKKQQSDAMIRSHGVIKQVFAEYEALSGRRYEILDLYRMEDAEAALLILNSPAATAKEAVDALRKKGKKVGLIRPNVIRPFPLEEIREALSKVKGLVVADRQDNYGAYGGAMTLEVKAALQGLKKNETQIASRIYGIGGKEFFVEDAETLLSEALEIARTGKVKVPYDYLGANAGETSFAPAMAYAPISEAAVAGFTRVETGDDGKMLGRGVNYRALTGREKRIAPGHGACPACGIFTNLDTFLKGIEGFVTVLFHTGCGMVVTTGDPYTAH